MKIRPRFYAFYAFATRPEYAGTIMNLQIVLNAQKNYLLKSTYPKKHLPKFS